MDACRNEELLTQLSWRSAASHSASSTSSSVASSACPVSDRCTFIQSTLATPADFLVLSWLACHLQAGEHVLLLHTARSRQHYTHVGRKWNVNVAATEAAGLLTLIDAFAPATSTTPPPLTTSQQLRQQQQQQPQPFALHMQLLQAVQASTHPLHVAIDDLTLLTLLTPSPAQLHVFLSNLRAHSASLLLAAPSDIPSHRQLRAHVAQWADCVLSLSALRTGASREVDGVLEVVKRDVVTGVDSSRVTLFYRLQANGVQLSTKGAQT